MAIKQLKVTPIQIILLEKIIDTNNYTGNPPFGLIT